MRNIKRNVVIISFLYIFIRFFDIKYVDQVYTFQFFNSQIKFFVFVGVSYFVWYKSLIKSEVEILILNSRDQFFSYIWTNILKSTCIDTVIIFTFNIVFGIFHYQLALIFLILNSLLLGTCMLLIRLFITMCEAYISTYITIMILIVISVLAIRSEIFHYLVNYDIISSMLTTIVAYVNELLINLVLITVVYLLTKKSFQTRNYLRSNE